MEEENAPTRRTTFFSAWSIRRLPEAMGYRSMATTASMPSICGTFFGWVDVKVPEVAAAAKKHRQRAGRSTTREAGTMASATLPADEFASSWTWLNGLRRRPACSCRGLHEPVIIGNATLYEATAVKSTGLPKVDAVITDPPYGLGLTSEGDPVQTRWLAAKKASTKLGWDKAIPDSGLHAVSSARGSSHCLGREAQFSDDLPSSRVGLFGLKGRTGPTMSDGELAWTNHKSRCALRICTARGRSLQSIRHRSPPELMEWCLSFVAGRQDHPPIPSLGSGTTGVTA